MWRVKRRSLAQKTCWRSQILEMVHKSCITFHPVLVLFRVEMGILVECFTDKSQKCWGEQLCAHAKLTLSKRCFICTCRFSDREWKEESQCDPVYWKPELFPGHADQDKSKKSFSNTWELCFVLLKHEIRVCSVNVHLETYKLIWSTYPSFKALLCSYASGA